eukprot:TRINITY_DN2916_c0_g1_i1.p1 TRINITY_DN2916_c0_g1~~TRINITY_DN2916_c0_g1_i1.p1  ORF type:complete len:100 (-),score=13.82 TRINITY_DN2916_c0_g1_i1:119-418(-)
MGCCCRKATYLEGSSEYQSEFGQYGQNTHMELNKRESYGSNQFNAPVVQPFIPQTSPVPQPSSYQPQSYQAPGSGGYPTNTPDYGNAGYPPNNSYSGRY